MENNNNNTENNEEVVVKTKKINEIDKLKKMNKKEISAATHISVKSLEHIMDNEYDELHHTKTLGFIKILEKTYSVDLDGWLDEFLEYKKSNPTEESNVINQRIEEKKSKTPLIFAFIIAIFVIAYFIFPIVTKSTTTDDSSNEIISEIKDNISEAKSITEANTVKNKDTIPIDDKLDTIKDNNKSKEESKEKEQKITITVPHNKPLEKEGVAKNDVEEEDNGSMEPLEQIELYTNKLQIKPRGKVWIGIVNTNNNTRVQTTVEKNGELELKDGHLLITGHSYFTFINEGVSYEYKDMKASYFYYKDGVLSKITKTHFKKLNRDSMW